MKNINKNEFTSKATAILTAGVILLSVFTPFAEANASEWYDTGWIYVDNSMFYADEKIDNCNVYLDHPFAILWSQSGGYHAWLDLNTPAGSYQVDMKIGYSYKTGTTPQTNETMRLYTGSGFNGTIPPSSYVDSANVADMGDDIVDSYESTIGCLDVMSAIESYSNVAGRKMSFPEGGDLAIKATGESLILYAVRIYGYQTTPDLVINKTVDKAVADPGDEIVYTIDYKNVGSSKATNVVVKDTFDYINQQYLTFISSNPSPSIGIDTWNIGTLNAGESGTITIRARISESIPSGTIEIKNRASIDSDQTPLQYSNCANVVVTKENPVISLSVSKLSKNITEGTSWQETVDAEPSQKIGFSIEISASGNTTAQSVSVVDFLPSNLDYINGTTKVDGSYVSDGIINSGINIGNIGSGYSKTITFEAYVGDENSFVSGYTTLTNIVETWADNASKQTDTAKVKVYKETYHSPYLSITKSVNKYSADPGDEIVYTINYKNTGQGTANNVVIKDPFNNQNQDYLTFISSSPSPTSGTSTWSVGDLSSGESGTITIRARISESIPSGSTIYIKNKATIQSDEISVKDSNYVNTWISVSGSLNIDKKVRNITDGSSFSSSVYADPGDELEFSLTITTTGNTTIEDVMVWDDLPNRLDYISGSTTLDGSYKSDGVILGGIYIDDLENGESATVKFRVEVDDEDVFNTGYTVLTNYGYVEANNYPTKNDTATVTVRKESGCSPSIHIDKLARNVSDGDSYWKETVYADPGDEVEFIIKLRSVGNETAYNTKVRDELPSKLEYISGSTEVDSYYKSDGITSSGGISIGNMHVDDYVEVKFKARVKSDTYFSSSTTTLTNYAYAWCDEGCEMNDTARVQVEKGYIDNSVYSISISKLGRNVGSGQTSWSGSFSASPNQEVEFSIQISNIGNEDLRNVKIWDALPANLNLISGSTTIDGVNWGGDITGNGLAIGTLYENETKTIKFRAAVASEDNFISGSTSLVNTAYVDADNIAQKYDQASVIVITTGKVLGVTTISTGNNLFSFIFVGLISLIIAIAVYCRLREDKLADILNNDKANKVAKTIAKTYFNLRWFTVLAKSKIKQF